MHINWLRVDQFKVVEDDSGVDLHFLEVTYGMHTIQGF